MVPTRSPDTFFKFFIFILALIFFNIFKKNILVSLQRTLFITNLEPGVNNDRAIRKAAELGSELTV